MQTLLLGVPGGVIVLSEEALIGMRVRVSESLLGADLRGLEGTIAEKMGIDAVEVLESTQHRYLEQLRNAVEERIEARS
jgi:hypothetical protein